VSELSLDVVLELTVHSG